MSEIIEMGTVSSRGQICIPNDIRAEMGLVEGTKIVFLLKNDSLVVKKVTIETFEEITKPLKEEAKKSGLKESDVDDIIHKLRKNKK
jgi:AbrB family looped-hinge helix DNA binding protein